MTGRGHVLKIGLVALVAFATVGFGFYRYVDSFKGSYGTYAVLPDGTKITVALAKTDEERARGLSGRDSLGDNEGMYFIFPREDRYGFWMKDMRFPIDILWIQRGELVGVEQDTPPEPGKSDMELMIYHPPEPVTTVLELKAGSAERYHLKTGDKVRVQIVPQKR